MTIKFQSKHKSGFTVNSPFVPMTFPAGEAHISGAEEWSPEDYTLHIADIRGHDPQDLFMLAMWANLLGPDAKKVLIMPYLPGARADRGKPFGAEVYAEFLNSLHLDKIIVLDPHSPVMPGLVHNVSEFPFERILRREIQDPTSDSKPQPYVGVIAPDKGAINRAERAARAMGVPMYRAEKTRDFKTGKLSGFHMIDELPETGKLLIVDDICDGGGTFLGLAAAIKKGAPEIELDLWVTHGVFSQGFVLLSRAFGMIHTTNSYYTPSEAYKMLKPEYPVPLKVHDITPYLYSEVSIDKLNDKR